METPLQETDAQQHAPQKMDGPAQAQPRQHAEYAATSSVNKGKLKRAALWIAEQSHPLLLRRSAAMASANTARMKNGVSRTAARSQQSAPSQDPLIRCARSMNAMLKMGNGNGAIMMRTKNLSDARTGIPVTDMIIIPIMSTMAYTAGKEN